MRRSLFSFCRAAAPRRPASRVRPHGFGAAHPCHSARFASTQTGTGGHVWPLVPLPGGGEVSVEAFLGRADDQSECDDSRETTNELEVGVQKFLRTLKAEAIPRYKTKAADTECEDASTVIATGLNHELQSRLEMEPLKRCEIDLERDPATGTWTATLVKMAGVGHEMAVAELTTQCGI
mmetsp:Transcript_17926/g.58002  ORF Transcript_17926/g.58002 Transcript_17926/m.58002 type:complete len:179 (+) Transcript_17926:33-569(+)